MDKGRNRQTDRGREGQTDRVREGGRQTDRQTDGDRQRHTERETRQTDRQRDRQAGRQTSWVSFTELVFPLLLSTLHLIFSGLSHLLSEPIQLRLFVSQRRVDLSCCVTHSKDDKYMYLSSLVIAAGRCKRRSERTPMQPLSSAESKHQSLCWCALLCTNLGSNESRTCLFVSLLNV